MRTITTVSAAIALALASGAALAGGYDEPEVVEVPVPQVEERRVVTKTERVLVPAIPAPKLETRAHALYLGVVSSEDFDVENFNDLDDLDGEDGDIELGDSGYLNYSPMGEGLSPVLGVKFGAVKGFNAGLGYAFNNLVKPYIGVNTNDLDDYFTSDVTVGGFAGVNVALPYGFAFDLGVETPDLDGVGEGGDALPFAGVGYRW